MSAQAVAQQAQDDRPDYTAPKCVYFLFYITHFAHSSAVALKWCMQEPCDVSTAAASPVVLHYWPCEENKSESMLMM